MLHIVSLSNSSPSDILHSYSIYSSEINRIEKTWLKSVSKKTKKGFTKDTQKVKPPQKQSVTAI